MAYYFDLNTNTLFLGNQVNALPQQDALLINDEDAKNLLDGIKAGGILYLEGDIVKVTPPSPSQMHYWSGTEWIITPEQQAVKKAEEIATVRERINALRDSKSAGGVYVEQLGKWFDSDDKAQKKLLGLKATMDLIGTEMTVDWTCADNTDFEGFGKPHLTAVIAAILQAENHNHTVARQHKAAVEKVENPLEYDYSTGWLKTYQDYLAEEKK